MAETDPSLTYTIEDFIKSKNQDQLTYSNFAITTIIDRQSFVQDTIINHYIDELKTLCVKVDSLSDEEIVRYRYSPDILSYDIYGTTQLDFIILLCNGIIDPKEFDFKKTYLMLPPLAILKEFLSSIYTAESQWIKLSE